MDGAPFVVGVGSLFHQFHSSHLLKFLAYMGQYVRTLINAASAGQRYVLDLKAALLLHCYRGKGPDDISPDVLNALLFLEALAKYEFTTRKTVEAYVPSYLFDRFKH